MTPSLLRKEVVFYAAVGGEQTLGTLDFTKMTSLTERDIKMRLLPMLRKKERFDLVAAQERTREYLAMLLRLTENEKQFLAAFRSGTYLPELLFDGDILERVRSHPMALWRIQNHS